MRSLRLAAGLLSSMDNYAVWKGFLVFSQLPDPQDDTAIP